MAFTELTCSNPNLVVLFFVPTTKRQVYSTLCVMCFGDCCKEVNKVIKYPVRPPPLPPPSPPASPPKNATTPTVTFKSPSDSRKEPSSLTPAVVYCGLDNLGFTCYVASCLQALYTANKIRLHLMSNPLIGPFHRSLSRLFHQMENDSRRSLAKYERHAVVAPREFLIRFREKRPEFTPGEHDAHEFLTILLDLVHQEENDTKLGPKPEIEPKSAREAWKFHTDYLDSSYLSRLFLGQMESELKCCACGHRSLSWSAFWQLQLDLSDPEIEQHNSEGQEEKSNKEKTLTVEECLHRLEAIESINHECNPQCSSCRQAQPSTKKLTICRAPHYLIVHLKRFTDTGHKVHRKVTINPNLQICAKTYTLSSVVMHKGASEQTGHYMTLFQQQAQRWVLFDDEKVQLAVKRDDVHWMLQHWAYICLYKSIRLNSSSDCGGNKMVADNEA